MPQLTLPQALESAKQMLQANQYAQAEPLIRQILQVDPNNAEAVHLLAYVANGVGNIDAALQLLRRAIELNPNVAVYHKNIGADFLSRNLLNEAAAEFQRAFQLDPNFADAVMNLGVVFEQQNRLNDALQCYQRALAINPNYPEALCNIADIYTQQNKLNEALTFYDRAIVLMPNLAEAYANRAAVYDKLGRENDAINDTTRALQLNPKLFHSLRAMGVFHYRRDEFDQSINYYRRAVEVNPNYGLGFSSLAIVYLRTGRAAEAVEACKQSIRCQPRFLDPHTNMGLALTDLGRHDEALASYANALNIEPNDPASRANRALVHLVMGNLEQGFADYDFRWKLPEFSLAGRDYKCPRWQGEPLAGKTLLLWHEQGFGDTIHFIRYAKLLADKGATVIAEVQPHVASLLRSVTGVSQVITRTDTLPHLDFHAPLLSLPGLFKTTNSTIPAEVPYIHPDPALVDQWRDRLSPHEGFRVGIAWSGNPLLRLEYERSIPLTLFAPLSQITGVKLIRLQMGPGSEQAQSAGFELIDLTSHIRDFSDTAALLSNLNLLITVDTAVLHLSAAMARPTWALIQRWPDWRWQLDREDSPWYPTLRLFRQQEYRSWPPVFARVKSELENLVQSSKK